jgi:hypothetical protein
VNEIFRETGNEFNVFIQKDKGTDSINSQLLHRHPLIYINDKCWCGGMPGNWKSWVGSVGLQFSNSPESGALACILRLCSFENKPCVQRVHHDFLRN